MVERDNYDQLVGPWTDQDYELLAILEEVSSGENIERPLAAYMADIKEVFE